MSEAAVPVRGIVFAHGRMAEGLVDAVRTISGAPEEALTPLTNQGRGPKALLADLEALVGDDPVLIFTDLQAGSCAMAAQLSCRDRGRRAVVCGANLPMLLDFVFHRELPLAELVSRLVEKGRESIQSLPGPAGHADRTAAG